MTGYSNQNSSFPQMSMRGFPSGSVVKNPHTMQEMEVRSESRSPGEGNGNLLQYSCLG